MKIEYQCGCTDDSLTIDGVESCDMESKELIEVIKKLLDREDDLGLLQYILIDLIEAQGDYEDLGICEECADQITKYSIEI